MATAKPLLDGIEVVVAAHRADGVTLRWGQSLPDKPGDLLVVIADSNGHELEIPCPRRDAPEVGTRLIFKLTEPDGPHLKAVG